jgi:hypothetical protein
VQVQETSPRTVLSVVSEVVMGDWSHGPFLMNTYPNCRLLAEKQVLSINHIVYTNNLEKGHPISLREQWKLFPDTNLSTSQVDLFKETRVQPAWLTLSIPWLYIEHSLERTSPLSRLSSGQVLTPNPRQMTSP